MMADASTNSSIFTAAGSAVAAVLEFIQEVALRLQLAFNTLVVTILEMVQTTNKLLGSWSPFKDLTDDLTSSIDSFNLKIIQGKEKIDDIGKGTKQLTTEVKKADTATKKQTTGLGKLADAAKKAAKEEKKLADEIADYVRKARLAITPTRNVTRHYEALKEEGLDLTEIMFTLGGEIDAAVKVFEEMGRELPEELALLVDLQTEADLASGALSRLISAEEGLADLSLKRPLEEYNQALKDITTEAGTTADAVKEKFDSSNAAITSSSTTFTTELENGFSTLLDGIDSDVVPGIDKIRAAFETVMSVVNTFTSTFDVITGFFGKDGIGGLDLGSLFGGGGDGGGIGGLFGGSGSSSGDGGGGFTSSFTELAITGVAIQNGIFGTGVSLTGVTIQKGEFNTGVALSGITIGNLFGGSGKSKEIAFNTRLTLAWIKDFFPRFNRSNRRVVELLEASLSQFRALRTWAEHHGIRLDKITVRMNELIPIQRDRIAPAVESINSKTPTEITFSPTIHVSVSGGGGQTPNPMIVGTQIGDQIIETVKQGIARNRGGLRTAIQEI